MRAPQIPKMMLPHTMTYAAFKGQGRNGVTFDEPITIEHVRFDESPVFSRDSQQTKVLAEGVIFVDIKHSKAEPSLPVFTEQSQIVIHGKKRIIKKAIPLYQVNSPDIHHWELEVV